MGESLKQQTVKGVLWSAIERFSVQGLQFILGVVLARILMPSDYGLVGMLTIFIAISQTIVDSGFSSALIQKKDRNEVDYSTAFYFNIVVGLVLYFILFFSAPLIARFYDTPQLEGLTKVIGINVFISSLAIVQRAKLTIKLDFKTQARASLSSVAIGGIIGITMAYNGFGVWSLVVQSIVRNGLNTFLLWIFSKWMPKEKFSKDSFKGMFSFGSKLLGAGLLNTVFSNVYLLIIGKLFSASDLGYYTRAKQFKNFPSQNITSIIQRVTYPVLSQIQDEEERLKKTYRKFIRLSAYIVFPLMVGLALVAKPLMLVVLTEKWLPAAPFLQILSVAGLLFPIHAINLNILNVKGRSDLFLKLEIIKKIVITITILITFSFGLKALVFGQIFTSIVSFFINTHYSGKLIDYGTKKQLKDLIQIAALCLPMAVAVFIIVYFVNNELLQLLLSIPAGAILYIGLSKVMKVPEFTELISIFRNRNNEK